MAINPATEYPGGIATPTVDYPYGEARNITVPGDGTGTPWEASLVNDVFGLQQALLKMAVIVPTGVPEKVAAAQYLQAILEISAGRAIQYDESGVADAYVLDVITDAQAPDKYFNGMKVRFIPGATNTTTSTVNVASLGIITITDSATPGVILAGVPIELIYNSTSGEFEISPYLNSFVAQTYSKQKNPAIATLTDGVNIAWNLDDAQSAKVTLGGNRTLDNPTKMVDGGTYLLRVIQDPTGTRTLSYGTAYKWPGGIAPTLTATGDAIDIITFTSDGISMYGVFQGNFS